MTGIPDRVPACRKQVREDRGVRKLRGRVAVVTGAASGIGLAIAEAFVTEGMQVVMADRDEEKLRRHAERLNDQVAGSAHAVPTDVTSLIRSNVPLPLPSIGSVLCMWR